MRFGPRIAIACCLTYVALAAPAWASDLLNVYVDNNQIALGTDTTLAAHAETDADFGGGHIVWKYKPASDACQPTPDSDDGTDATGGIAAGVAAGPSTADVGGQTISLGVGSWLVCGWLVDDAHGTIAATSQTTVNVVPFMGSIAVSIKRVHKAFQFVLTYTTSAPAHVYAVIQKAHAHCAVSPATRRGKTYLLLPRRGRFVGSDGGLGRSVGIHTLPHGHWRVCTWVKAPQGAAGPATKTFSVPRQRRRHGGHAAG